MTKNEIANQINNNISDITRQIQTSYELDYSVDEMITTEKAESWTDGGEFRVEDTKEFTYIIRCTNECPVHVVDYDNENETYELGAEGCEYEKEVLVSANTKFRVTYVAPAGDMNEIGFVTIEVEYVGAGENESN